MRMHDRDEILCGHRDINIRRSEPTLLEVVWAWWNLCLLYNILLVSLVIYLCVRAEVSPLASIIFLFDGLIANLCFWTGPLVEGSCVRAGASRFAARWTVFCLGLALTAGMAIDWAPTVLRQLDR